jgi:hypothetical protein
MGRPRTVPRTPQARAEYRQLMASLAELKERRRQSDIRALQVALMEFYAPKARAILVAALTNPKLSPDERYALAASLVADDE